MFRAGGCLSKLSRRTGHVQLRRLTHRAMAGFAD